MEHLDTVYDSGLQQERTVLAWDRSALALIVASGLLIRAVGDFPLRAIVVLPAGSLIIGLSILIVDRHRYLVRWRRMERGGSLVSNVLVTLIGVTTIVLGATALVVVSLLWLR